MLGRSLLGSIVVFSAFPPTSWCRCGDGACPGVTSLVIISPLFAVRNVSPHGSILSTTSCEHEKRSMALEREMSASPRRVVHCMASGCRIQLVCDFRYATGTHHLYIDLRTCISTTRFPHHPVRCQLGRQYTAILASRNRSSFGMHGMLDLISLADRSRMRDPKTRLSSAGPANY